MVADGAANMKLAISKFKNVVHVPCAAQRLNLCVLDIFKEKKMTIVKEVIKSKSSSIIQMFVLKKN